MKKLRVILQRLWKDFNQSTGILYIINETGQPIWASICIERGDRNNERNVSNVPPGTYPLVFEHSGKFNRDLWELKDVPGRAECKIHPANFWDQLNGCIAPGNALRDLDADGYYDVTNSVDTCDSFHAALNGLTKTKITVIDPIVEIVNT